MIFEPMLYFRVVFLGAQKHKDNYYLIILNLYYKFKMNDFFFEYNI